MVEQTPDRGEIDEAFAVFGPAFVVFAETARASEPSEGALNDPPDRDDDKALGVGRAQRDFQVNPEGVVNADLARPGRVKAV
jgi:hypothetical protein